MMVAAMSNQGFRHIRALRAASPLLDPTRGKSPIRQAVIGTRARIVLQPHHGVHSAVGFSGRLNRRLGLIGVDTCSGSTVATSDVHIQSRRTSAASTRCAAPTPPCRPRTSRWGYKQLLQVERGWRDLKSILDLRPVYHRREDHIRAHVLLCWLALLLIRIIEHETGDTWRNIRNELQRLHLGTFTAPPAPAS